MINIVSLPLSNTMHESSKNHPPEADEFEKAGLTPAPCEMVTAPRVEEAGVSMECVLDRILPLGTDHLIIGKMVCFHVRDELYENGCIDVAKLQPLGRLAGIYTKVETHLRAAVRGLLGSDARSHRVACRENSARWNRAYLVNGVGFLLNSRAHFTRYDEHASGGISAGRSAEL